MKRPLSLIFMLIILACPASPPTGDGVIVVPDDTGDVASVLDASVADDEAPIHPLDAGPSPAMPVGVDSGPLATEPTMDAGQESTAPVDAGTAVTLNCAQDFFAALAPHMTDLVVVQGESDSEWTNFEASSAQSGAITLDELRALFAQVGAATEGEIRADDWGFYLEGPIEYAANPAAAQAALDSVEAIFDLHLTDVIFVHFGADADVEHYFLRVGRSACGEVLGLWTVVIWT